MEGTGVRSKRTWRQKWKHILLALTLLLAAAVLFWADISNVLSRAEDVGATPTGVGIVVKQKQEVPYRIVTAFFGTDRDRVSQVRKPGDTFGTSRGALRLGTVQVSIPFRHKTGEIERPRLYLLEFNEDPAKHFVLLEAEDLPKAAFRKAVSEAVAAKEGKKAFVFIHGYKTSFEEAAQRTAQMAEDFGLKLVPAFFSWPSQGSLARYTVDEANAEWTEPHLVEFLESFADWSDAREVVVIAHSMGARASARAMGALFKRRADLRTRFRHLVLAAPDIDSEVFKRDILPNILAKGQHVTLYASSNDKALKASKEVHGSPRAGESGPSLVVAPGLETVDASGIDTDFFGHSYFAETRPLLADIELLVNVDLPAERRPTLQEMRLGGQRYWAFRP
jgi:esterase/lipase superfamily enzyme